MIRQPVVQIHGGRRPTLHEFRFETIPSTTLIVSRSAIAQIACHRYGPFAYPNVSLGCRMFRIPLVIDHEEFSVAPTMICLHNMNLNQSLDPMCSAIQT